MRQASRWLLQEPSRGAAPVLFAFPFAGSGVASFRRWPKRIGEIEIHPVQLPGREYRIKEEPYQTFDAFADDAVEALAPYIERPYAVIGHCMGALLAHAFTARAQEIGAPPLRLFSSASLVPARGFYGFYHPWMSDRRIARELQRVSSDLGDGRIPDDLVPLSVRVLRRDVQMCLGHAPPAKEIGVPISAIGWEEDLDVSPEDLAEWRDYGVTREYVLPGDPLTFLTAPRGLLKVVDEDFEY